MPKFKNRLQARKDVVNLARAIYSDETNMSFITDFDQNYTEYNKEAIMKWYTQESFLYKITNNCLRIATSDSIQYCRLLLKDIEQAIKEQYKEKSKHFCGALYRGAYLSQEEWSSLKVNLGREIEMHGFLSVSKVKNVALHFMQENPNQKVFITVLVPRGPNEEEQGFAEVEEFSKYPQEKEILFNVRSRFTVLEAEDTCPGDLLYRHLVLLYGAQGFRRCVTEENPMQEILIPNVESIVCSICSCHSISTNKFFTPIASNMTKRSYFFESCLPELLAFQNSSLLYIPIMDGLRTPKINIKGFMLNYPIELKLPMFGYKCSQCQAKYREVYFKCTECSRERKEVWCENCLASQADCIQKGYGIVLESNPFSFWCERMSENELKSIEFQNQLMDINTIIQQAEMYFESNQYKKALEYYSIYLQRNDQNKPDINLSLVYGNMARIYENQGEYKKALEYLLKGLKIYELSDGKSPSGISAYYGNLGLIYDSLGEYDKALEYLEKALKLTKSVDGEINSDVANSYNNLATVYYKKGEIERSLEYFEKALKIHKSAYGNIHPIVAASLNNLGNVYKDHGDLKKALDFLSKALEIKKSFYGENHYLIGVCENNFGEIFTGQGEFRKALEYHKKALDIWNPVEKSSQPEIAICCDSIGVAHEKLEEYEKALEYYNKALEIRRSFFGENHPETIKVENQIEMMGKDGQRKGNVSDLEIRKN